MDQDLNIECFCSKIQNFLIKSVHQHQLSYARSTRFDSPAQPTRASLNPLRPRTHLSPPFHLIRNSHSILFLVLHTQSNPQITCCSATQLYHPHSFIVQLPHTRSNSPLSNSLSTSPLKPLPSLSSRPFKMFRLPRLALAVLLAVALIGVEAKPKVSTKNSKQAAQLQVSRYLVPFVHSGGKRC